MADKNTCTITRPMYWNGKNYAIGDAIELSEMDTRWQEGRKAVTRGAPAPKKKAPKAKK